VRDYDYSEGIPDVEPPDGECKVCGGEGTVWTHERDPQDDVEIPCRECRPDAFSCWKCRDTGYTRDPWTNRKQSCPECWQEH
jgi:hypothetical protein